MNSPLSELNWIKESITSHNDFESLGKYIVEIIQEYSIEKLLLSQDTFSFIHPTKPWIDKSFYERITERIERRINSFFKSGLHQNQEKHNIEVELLIPRNSTLEKIESGELEWALLFKVRTHLTPRYLKDGDKWFYDFVFEVQISERTYGQNIVAMNSSIIRTGNRVFKVAFIYPNKTEPKTTLRDESMKRSRDAYRTRLMNVLRLQRASWQKK